MKKNMVSNKVVQRGRPTYSAKKPMQKNVDLGNAVEGSAALKAYL